MATVGISQSEEELGIMFCNKFSKKTLSLNRVWRDLTKRGETYAAAKIGTYMVLQKLQLPTNAFWGLFPENLALHLDQRVRQIIIERQLFGPIQKEIMLSASKPAPIAHLPIPSVWRKKLREYGVNISTLKSQMMLLVASARLMAAGIRQIYRLLHIDNSNVTNQFCSRPEAVLMDKNILSYQSDESEISETKCFTNWMAKRMEIECKNGDIWVHVSKSKSASISDGVFRVGSPFPELPNKLKKLIFLFQCVRVTVIVGLRWMTFGWWAPALLSDAIDIIYLQQVDPKSLAKSYWFDNNKALDRPLWTFFLKEKDIVIRMVFLSTNICTHWLAGQPEPDIHPYYKLMNWHNYVVWDDVQAEVINEMVDGQINIEIVGPIPSGDNGQSLTILPERTIAVFEVSPHRSTRMANLGFLAPYFSFEISLRFINDLIKVTRETGWSIAFKKKRDNNHVIDRQYLCALRQLKTSDNIIMIDPNISADRLVEASSAVVGIPFTSPCIMAKLIGIPSAFYDPTNKIILKRKYDHGVDFLAGADALHDWIGRLDAISVLDNTQGHHN